MSERLQRHHLNWTRRDWLERRISKEVRNEPAFSIFLPALTHRYLHLVLEPPEVPGIDTLLEMRAMSRFGLETVIDCLDHPIAEHYETQLSLGSITPRRAGRLIVGYNAQKTSPLVV